MPSFHQHELSRKHELQKFLKEFTGYLHSDGYTAYGKLQL
ncbi:MAG: IS66 family transposase [Enterococcus sp.]